MIVHSRKNRDYNLASILSLCQDSAALLAIWVSTASDYPSLRQDLISQQNELLVGPFARDSLLRCWNYKETLGGFFAQASDVS